MYNSTKYSTCYYKILGSLWKYCKHESDLSNHNIADFNGVNNTDLFNFKVKVTSQIGNVELVVSVRYLSNFEL